MILWRPVLAGVVSWGELATTMSFDDLLRLNAMMDAKDELEAAAMARMRR